MNSRQIETIVHAGKYRDTVFHWKLVETHISYVLLGPAVAFKIKKNIHYSFLDFSTLKKRKHFCEQEVALNNRLSKGVYLGVVPVLQDGEELTIDGKSGKIIDYAVHMKRLQGAKQMHVMLDKKQVSKKHMKTLAVLIRDFHCQTTVIKKIFNPQQFVSRFNDILTVSDFISTALGAASVATMKKAVRMSDAFLHTHHDLFIQRIENGFTRDCHGDLHSRNIFLYHRPIIFDCIEFNDEFRQIDILDELAFFCMDLEAEGLYDLSKAFTTYYFRKAKNNFGSREQLLFTYYKCYRANVRAKVNALRAMQATEPVQKKWLAEVKKYLSLMDSYLVALA